MQAKKSEKRTEKSELDKVYELLDETHADIRYWKGEAQRLRQVLFDAGIGHLAN